MNLENNVIITEQECDELERRFYELNGLKVMIKDINNMNNITNTVLIDRLIEKYVLASTAYEMIWSIISNRYFTGDNISKPKTCDFENRIVKLTGGI